MAKFRLLSAHQLRHNQYSHAGDMWLPGDKENEHLGDEKGTLVGDGTPYPVVSATLEMIPLDEEAEAMIEAEKERLAKGAGTMNPIDQLSTIMQANRDDYEERYIPGFDGKQRPRKGA